MSVETDIALIKKDLENGNEIFHRLDKAIDRLSEVLTAMREVSVLQEQRIAFLENGLEDLYETMEKRNEKLDAIKVELKKEFDNRFNNLEDNIGSLSKKIWMITGAALVIGYLIASLDLTKLFT
jgi:chromosome segregation ATPase